MLKHDLNPPRVFLLFFYFLVSILSVNLLENSLSSPVKAQSLPSQEEIDQLTDYDYKTPLPSTGRVTIRQDLNAFDRQKMLTSCPSSSQLYGWAESRNYFIQICAVNGIPRYWISRQKSQRNLLIFEDKNSNSTRQLVFRKNDRNYILYRDGRGANCSKNGGNAYLEIYQRTPQKVSLLLKEALLYLFEVNGSPDPRC